MANVRTFNRSFGGGEISPEMFGRIDDNKFQTGAATMRNFIAKPQGPAENRPGLQFVREVKTSTAKTRLIPFTFSTAQTAIIELGAGYFRFHSFGLTLMTDGTFDNYLSAKTPYEVANTYLAAELFDIHYVQSNDVLTLVHPAHKPAELRRNGVVSWVLSDIAFGATVGAPTVNPVSVTRGKTTAITFWTFPAAPNPSVFTTSSEHFLNKGDTVFIDGEGDPNLPNGFYVVGTIPVATQFTLIDIQFGWPIRFLAGTGALMQTASATTYVDNSYKVTALGPNGVGESAASAAVTATNNLYVSGASNTISWGAVAGATKYEVYKMRNGLYGYIGSTESLSFTDDNIAPDFSITPPIYDSPATFSSDYPGAVSYFEQRRVFAGTGLNPQSVWLTKSNTESDTSYSLPIKDTDRILFKISSREANTIRHIVPLNQLILLSSSAEWRVSSVNSDALTPSSISVRPQSYVGASNVQPSVINNSLVYCASRGGHVRELGYNWQANGFITGDLSLRSTHLFDNYEITDMCYSKSPQPLLWFVSTSGKLIGLTYIPEQQIGAWHWHDTDGTFESCTVVAEAAEDVLYVVVNRTIGGVSKRYVERLASRQFATLNDAFFVDSGASYNGTNTNATTVTVTGGTTWGPADVLTITASTPIFAFPATTDINDAIVITGPDGTEYRLTITGTTSTTVATAMVDKVLNVATPTANYAFARNTFTGLSHLEGKTVSILADGAVINQQVVVGGSVTIDRAATKVHIGLPYQSDLQTLPLVMQIDNGFGQGRYKNVNKAWIKVYRSSGIFIGPDASHLVQAKQRTNDPYGSAPSLKTQEIQVLLTPTWAESGSVYIRQIDPLPLTIIGMTLEVAVGA